MRTVGIIEIQKNESGKESEENKKTSDSEKEIERKSKKNSKDED